MARLFDNPMSMLLILLVVMLLFGAPKLPGMARSLGESLRILKSEITDLSTDERPGAAGTGADLHPAPAARHATAAHGVELPQQVPATVTRAAPAIEREQGRPHPHRAAVGETVRAVPTHRSSILRLH